MDAAFALSHRRHRPTKPCEHCRDWPDWWRDLAIRIMILEEHMTENQAHLNTDIAAIGANVQTVIAELKAQPGAQALDFTAADALVASTQAEADADAPPAPPA